MQIAEQFNGIDKVEKRYREAHLNRIKYERRSKGLINLILYTFSKKAQQNDLYNLQSDQSNDYLNNYTGQTN